MNEKPMRWQVPAGLALLGTLAVIVAVLVSATSGAPTPTGSTATIGPSANAPVAGAIAVRISGRPVGRPIASGYLGFSIEFQAVRAYTGPDPRHINPVLVQLIRNLTPGQPPVLRIGGDSTDVSWVPAPGVKAPPYVSYRLTPSWLTTTAALARSLGARMIMGLNLAADQPALDAAEATAYRRVLGPRLAAMEIGNEPNVYRKITLLRTLGGKPLKTRPRSFGYPAFAREFTAVARRSGSAALAGPALAVGPTADPGTWQGRMGGFLAGLPQVRTFTLHRYPLRNCFVPSRSPQYPSISHLLSDYSSTTLAAGLRRWIQIAHRHGRAIRVDELNSVACRGRTGVSDTFASSLWVTDALFSLARAGVDGIDMHTLPDAAYQLFSFSHAGGHWQAHVAPVYYGLQLFAQAAPAGSRLIAVDRGEAPVALRIWAVRVPGGSTRVVLINKDPHRSHRVSLRLPAAVGASATVQRLQAGSVAATSGVSLGGRTYGASTATGELPPARTDSLTVQRGTYTLSLPQGSAALISFPG